MWASLINPVSDLNDNLNMSDIDLKKPTSNLMIQTTNPVYLVVDI